MADQIEGQNPFAQDFASAAAPAPAPAGGNPFAQDFADQAPTQEQVEASKPTFGGEVLKHIKHAPISMVQGFGGAASYAGNLADYNGFKDIGKSLMKLGDDMKYDAAMAENEGNTPDPNAGIFTRMAGGAAEGLTQMAGTTGAGALAGSVIPGVGTVAGAVVGTVLGLPAFFGMGADQGYEENYAAQLKAGATPQEARYRALAAGGAKGAVMVGSEAVLAKIGLGKTIAPVLEAAAGAKPGQVVADILGTSWRKAGVQVGESAGKMGAISAGQDAAIQGIDMAAGGREEFDPMQTVESGGMGIGMGLVTGSMGAARGASKASNAVKTLGDTGADPQSRQETASGVATALFARDKQLSLDFATYADNQIAKNLPIEVQPDAFYTKQAQVIRNPLRQGMQNPGVPLLPAPKLADVTDVLQAPDLEEAVARTEDVINTGIKQSDDAVAEMNQTLEAARTQWQQTADEANAAMVAQGRGEAVPPTDGTPPADGVPPVAAMAEQAQGAPARPASPPASVADAERVAARMQNHPKGVTTTQLATVYEHHPVEAVRLQAWDLLQRRQNGKAFADPAAVKAAAPTEGLKVASHVSDVENGQTVARVTHELPNGEGFQRTTTYPDGSTRAERVPAAEYSPKREAPDGEARAAGGARQGDLLNEPQQTAAPSTGAVDTSATAVRAKLKADPAFKTAWKEHNEPHPESGVAGQFLRGWLDAEAGKPMDREQVSKITPEMKPKGFNPVDSYQSGYLSKSKGKPFNVRTMDRAVRDDKGNWISPEASIDQAVAEGRNKITEHKEDDGTWWELSGGEGVPRHLDAQDVPHAREAIARAAEAPKAEAEQPAAPRTVTVNDETHTLTPEQAKAWDAADADHAKLMKLAASSPNPDVRAKYEKRAGMERAAKRRKITGALTGKEKEKAAVDAKLARPGRKATVTLDDGSTAEGTVEKVAYGKVNVTLEDGRKVLVDRQQVDIHPDAPKAAKPPVEAKAEERPAEPKPEEAPPAEPKPEETPAEPKTDEAPPAEPEQPATPEAKAEEATAQPKEEPQAAPETPAEAKVAPEAGEPTTDAPTGRNLEETAPEVRDLQAALDAESGGQGPAVEHVDPATLPDKPEKGSTTISKKRFAMVEKLANIFGLKVRLYRGAEPEGLVLSNDNKTVYLNADASSAEHLVIVGHEIAHLMKRNAPKLYKEMADALATQFKGDAAREFYRYYNQTGEGQGQVTTIKFGKKGKVLGGDVRAEDGRSDASIDRALKPGTRSHEQMLDEFIGDLVGNRTAEFRTWAKMFRELGGKDNANKKLVYRLADFITSFIDRLMDHQAFRKFATDRWVRDLKSVRQNVIQGLKEYARFANEEGFHHESERMDARRENVAEARAPKEKAPELSPEEREAQAQINRSNAAKEREARARQVDPVQDDLHTAIAKLGGLNKDEIKSQWGLEVPATEARRGTRWTVSPNGLSIEAMAEKLHELGYLHDTADLHNELAKKFESGESHYTFEGQEEQARRDYEAEKEREAMIHQDDDIPFSTRRDEPGIQASTVRELPTRRERKVGAFDEAERTGKLGPAVEHIAANGSTEGARQLATRLAPLVREVGFKASGEHNTAEDAHYDYFKNRVVVHTNGRSEEVVLHETVHAATMARLTKAAGVLWPRNAEEKSLKSAYNELESIRRQVLAQESPHELVGKRYGLTDLNEFLAELHTNPEFRELLKSKQVEGRRSLWQRAVDGVRKLLGLPDNREMHNALDLAMSNGGEFFGEARQARNRDIPALLTHKARTSGGAKPKMEASSPTTDITASKKRVQPKDFGPVHEQFKDDPEGAIARLMQDKTGEATAVVTREGIGPISLVYGDKAMGLAHIVARRGEDFLKKVPALLRDGTVYSRPGVEDRVYIGSPDSETVIRLDYDGKDKTWLVTAYDRFPAERGEWTEGLSGPASTASLDGLARTRGNPESNRSDEIVGENGDPDITASPRRAQTETPEFKKWFGESKAVDENGEPLTLYHGTAKDFDNFKPSKTGMFGAGIYVTPDPAYADSAAQSAHTTEFYGRRDPEAAQHVMPVYVSIKNPWDASDPAAAEIIPWNLPDEKMQEFLKARGYDGVRAHDQWVAFEPSQVKSAVGNSGEFDASAPSITASKKRAAPYMGPLSPEQAKELEKVGGVMDVPSIKDRVKARTDGLGLRLEQGLAHRYAAIRQFSQLGFWQARVARGSDGGLEAIMKYGKVFAHADGAYDVKINEKDPYAQGFAQAMAKLKGEHNRFFWWVAAHRAEDLKKLGLENLFDDKAIRVLKGLDKPDVDGGHADRPQLFADALKTYQDFNDSVLKIAEESGLLDAAGRKMWASHMYVPFYRSMAETGDIAGPRNVSGLVNQFASHTLKGGTDKLNSDLLANVMQNWSHLLGASARNRAARTTLEAAKNLGAAHEVPASLAGKNGVKVMVNGKTQHWQVTDKPLMGAMKAMYAEVPKWMSPLSSFKQLLTFGVTVMPGFKYRNWVRDSITTVGVSDATNLFKNQVEGWKATKQGSQVNATMLASGALIRFGNLMKDGSAQTTNRLIRNMIDPNTVLDSDSKLKAIGEKLRQGFEHYQELGDRSENINRAGLFQDQRAKGKGLLESAFNSRDLLDFSDGGTYAPIQFLVQSVPFLNARIQGLFKIGSAMTAKETRKQALITAGAVTMASLALLLAYQDDPDWKARLPEDRDNYWWFKVGGVAHRIPKPFELGAMGTIAERMWELKVDPEMTDTKFVERVRQVITQQFAMNPIPQIFKPLDDVYANVDSFTGRPIENMSMEKLRPQDRYDPRSTSAAARLMGEYLNLPDPRKLLTGHLGSRLSPVQYDALLKGYFGGLGQVVVNGVDHALKPALDMPAAQPWNLRDFSMGIMESLPSTNSSRYMGEMYDHMRDVEQAYNSYRQALNTGDADKARKLLKDNKTLITQYSMMELAKREESQLTAQAKRISVDKRLTADEKQERLKKLNKLRNDIAQRFMGLVSKQTQRMQQ